MATDTKRLTSADFNVAHVLSNRALMADVKELVARRPDPSAFDEAAEDLFVDLISEALKAYYCAGRKDVDDDSEMLGVTLRDMYRDAYKAGRADQALKMFMVDALAELATTYAQ